MAAAAGCRKMGPGRSRRDAARRHEGPRAPTMPTTTAASSRLHDRLARETTPRSASTAATAGSTRPTPASTRSSRSASSSPGRPPTWPPPSRIAAEEGVPVLPRGAATSLSGQTVGAGARPRRLEVPEPDRRRRPRPDDRPGRAGGGARPAQRPPQAARPDVRARRLDRRPRHDRRDDRQQLGRGPVAPLRQDRRPRPVARRRPRRRHARHPRPGRRRATWTPSAPARPRRPAPPRRSATTVGRAPRRRSPRGSRRSSGGSAATTSTSSSPACPSGAEGWVDDPWRFNLARLIVGSEGTLAVVAGAELKVVPIPTAQGLVVLSFATIPAALDRLAEIVATGPGGRRDARPDDPRPRRRQPRLRPAASTSPRAGPPPSSPRSSTPTAPRSWPTAPTTWPGGSRAARASSASARASPTPAKDDFWKVRKAGLLAADGDGRRRQAGRVRRGHGRLPRPPPRVLRAVLRDRRPARDRQAACYGHADVGCLHIRPILNVKTERGGRVAPGDRPRGRRPRRRVRRRDERRARRRPRPEPLERQAVRPRGLRRLRGGQARLRPRQPDEPRQGRRLARPRRRPPDRPRLPRPSSPSRPSSTSPTRAGSPGAVEMCSGVGACRKTTAGRCARATWSPATRSTPPAAGPTPSGWSCPASSPPTGWSNETLHDALDLCLQCKACKSECPSNVDMAKLKAEVLHQKYRARPVPLGSLLMGHIHRLNPIGSATAPLANWTLRQPAFNWLLEKVAGIDRRRTLPDLRRDHLRTWFRRHAPDPRAGTRGTVVLLDDCFTTYNTPEVGRAAVRVLEASRLPGRAGGPALLRPAGDLEGAARRSAATWPARTSPGWSTAAEGGRRSSAASRAAC